MRLLHYEGRVSEPTKGIFGAGADTDFYMLAVLVTDDVIGLQICKDKYAKPQVWEYVPPLRGSFIGDLLERLSSCLFRSTRGLVLGNGQERCLIPFCVTPSYDYVIEYHPTCKSVDNPTKFPPIKSGDYLLQRYMDTSVELSSFK